ncbi:MAG: AMP-binding protein [Carbonactinosporaceae bacterium]
MAYGTIPELLDAAAARSPDKDWLLYGDERYSYAQAAGRVAAIAGGLAARGVGRGSLVLATARNSPAYLFCWLAVVRLGAVYVPVNPRSSREELAGLVAQTQPHLVVTDTSLRDAVGHGAAGKVDVDDLASGSRPASPAEPRDIPPRPEDPAVLIPTSGTTGRSKLVTQTHRGYAMAGEGFPYWMQLTADDRLMTSLPLFHINAPAYSVLGSVAAGASLVLLPRFSASTFLASARRHGATEFNAIGAMLEMLMNQPARPDDADNPLRRCYTGPSPPKERHLQIEERFGIEIVCGYALSESPYGLCWRHGTRPYGTLGSLRQHPHLGTVNEGRVMDDGHEVLPGGVGELELRNPAVMLGYWGMPEETGQVLVDGWLRTGDLVRDNGDTTFTFVGRRKEVIRRRGENLSPAEVEAALAEHPDVVEAAVVGVTSALTEEEVKAFVVLREGASAELAEIREFAARRLAGFKVPRYVEVAGELPHTPTGRVAKRQLPAGLTGREWDAGQQRMVDPPS